ncbi:hypothetical protein PFMC_06009, partial [Plasmodium falciparum CAMP/Malaysia]
VICFITHKNFYVLIIFYIEKGEYKIIRHPLTFN